MRALLKYCTEINKKISGAMQYFYSSSVFRLNEFTNNP